MQGFGCFYGFVWTGYPIHWSLVNHGSMLITYVFCMTYLIVMAINCGYTIHFWTPPYPFWWTLHRLAPAALAAAEAVRSWKNRMEILAVGSCTRLAASLQDLVYINQLGMGFSNSYYIFIFICKASITPFSLAFSNDNQVGGGNLQHIFSSCCSSALWSDLPFFGTASRSIRSSFLRKNIEKAWKNTFPGIYPPNCNFHGENGVLNRSPWGSSGHSCRRCLALSEWIPLIIKLGNEKETLFLFFWEEIIWKMDVNLWMSLMREYYTGFSSGCYQLEQELFTICFRHMFPLPSTWEYHTSLGNLAVSRGSFLTSAC